METDMEEEDDELDVIAKEGGEEVAGSEEIADLRDRVPGLGIKYGFESGNERAELVFDVSREPVETR